MRRKHFVKLTALATAAVMAVSPAVVFADDSTPGATSAGSSIEGTGNLEGIVNKDVFKVKLPTTATGDTNFILDPQGLLNIANNTLYQGGTGAIYFKNKGASGAADTYSNTSDAIEIINKSSYDIDVAFSVKVELPEGVQMVETKAALADATKPSIYLEMKESEDEAPTALKAGDNSAKVKLVDKVAEAAGTGYEIKATAKTDGTGYDYTYELGDSFDETAAAKASYTLSGQCDTTADWSAVNALEADKKTVKTTIVWSAKKHTDSYFESTTVTASSNSVAVSLPEGVTLSKAELTLTDGTGAVPLTNGNQFTLNDTSFTVSARNVTSWVGANYTKIVLTFSDGTSETITLQ